MNLKKGEISYLNRLIDDFKEKERYSSNYLEIYIDDYDKKLAMVFSSFHNWLNDIFNYMNQRIANRHFHADNSREAIDLFKKINGLLGVLNKYKVQLFSDYNNRIKEIKTFLSPSGGSPVPENFIDIEIQEIEPIFINIDTIAIPKRDKTFNIEYLTEGSYAKIFEYFDDFYNEPYIIKRAKDDLTEKELKRFEKEFEVTRNLSSPFVIKVYNYDDNKKEYIMEKADATLNKYVEDFKLIGKKRKIIIQLITAFKFIHERDIFHRDISLKNILIKEYDDTLIIKISDFGLVKEFESHLTSLGTDVKGTIIDPYLEEKGFKDYDLENEIYSLTCIIAMILLNENNLTEIRNTGAPEINEFLKKGCSLNKDERIFKDLNTLKREALKLINILGLE